MSKYLITGGAGFIGSNIVKKLLDLGESVRVLDNLATGHLKNIKPYLDKIEFIEGDFTDIEVARKAVSGVDYVLHQGAIASVLRSIDDPITTNNANILGTLNMLVASRDAEVKRFVYAASSSAYGDTVASIKTETLTPSPKSPYAIQKYAGEMYCKDFYKIYGLETVCLRYFNVFGPNQDPDSLYSAVIPTFVKKVVKGESPIIYGDGENSRDFTFVLNNVEANILATKAPIEACGEVINIACGKKISIYELLKKINEILGKDIKPIYEKDRKGDVKDSLADISKAKRLLGYEPVVDFDTGLKMTIDYYKSIF